MTSPSDWSHGVSPESQNSALYLPFISRRTFLSRIYMPQSTHCRCDLKSKQWARRHKRHLAADFVRKSKHGTGRTLGASALLRASSTIFVEIISILHRQG